jgi:hypothetical protein
VLGRADNWEIPSATNNSSDCSNSVMTPPGFS